MKLLVRPLKRLFVGLVPVGLALVGAAGTALSQGDPFPPSSPEAQGLSSADLDLLADQVEYLVDSDAVVGAELHVIQNRRTVLRRAFGHADRDAERRMRVDQVYCIRSMTKPVTGTVIQMLIDEGKLSLGTKVADLLPAFDQPHTRAITVEHLLTHTTGLGFSTISRALTDYEDGIVGIANEAAASTFQFEVGTDFQYSDAGTDTLGAIIEVVTGQPLHEVVQERVLDPLGMTDSWTLLEGREDRARIPSAYSGGVGTWERHYDPSATVMFPFFLGSQSLYCSTTDYARFLALWMDRGRVGDETLLSTEAIRRGLRPNHQFDFPNAFEGLDTFYAQLWMSWSPGLGQKPAVFGHNGSDGTYAWAWPERDLIVLYFTQSRGSDSGLAVEEALARILFRGEAEAFRAELTARGSGATNLGRYTGIYWDEDNPFGYYVLSAGERGLAIERPGQFRKELTFTGTPGHFAIDSKGKRVLEFQAEGDGPAGSFLFPFGNRVETQVRHVPEADAPTVEAILAQVGEAHGLDRFAQLGAVRLRGTIAMPSRKLEGPIEVVFDGTRSRTDVEMAGQKSTEWITADGRFVTVTNGAEPVEVQGDLREQATLSHTVRRLQDWTEQYESVEFLRTISIKGRRIHMVRTVPREARGSTKLIDADSGLLLGEDRIDRMPGAGILGLELRYGDYRDLGEGFQTPMRIEVEYSHPLIPKMVMTFEEFEVGVDAEEDLTAPVVEK